MIDRYTLPKMGRLWTDLHKRKMWFKVELAVLWAKEQNDNAPAGVYNSAKTIRITKKILKHAEEIEKETDHDLIAFVLAVT